MALHRSTDRPPPARSGSSRGLQRMRRRVGWRRGPRRRSFARTAGAAACAYRGGSSFNFGRTRRAVVEKVSGRSANEIGSVAPKSSSLAKSAPNGARDERAAGQYSGTSPSRAERSRRSRPAAERTVGNGLWSEDVSRCAGVGFRTTLRRSDAGVGSSAECVRVAEKGRTNCGLRSRRGTRENSDERNHEDGESVPRTASGLRGEQPLAERQKAG